LRGKNLALLGSDGSPQGEDRVQEAAVALGMQVARLPADVTHARNAGASSARLLAQLYDAVDGGDQADRLVTQLGRDGGIVVFDGLGSDQHPTRVLAELMAMCEQTRKPLNALCLCFEGDPRGPCGRALLHVSALTGLNLQVAAPRSQWPGSPSLRSFEQLARAHGGRLGLAESAAAAAVGADFVLDTTSPERWSLQHGEVHLDDVDRRAHRHFMLQAVLVTTLN
jgi:ornithine carbamoyltransferase